MAEPLLFLAHRVPYPPNKGDKIRSYHLLRHLCSEYEVHLGAFVDAPEDLQHRAALDALCKSVYLVPLDPKWRRWRSLTGLLTGEALSCRYYDHAGMHGWAREVMRQNTPAVAFVFSSPMAQYVAGDPFRGLTRIADFVDADSAKWLQYARARRWPVSWLYRRESERLLAFERRVAAEVDAIVFVSAEEAAVFSEAAPEAAPRVHTVENGVDTEYFRPGAGSESPYRPEEQPIVFTGAMDYWANVDAVSWFAREVLPIVRTERPGVRLHVVGARPSAVVRRLADWPDVAVSGAVPDVRPFLEHARLAVAPMRVARGVQNKVLEALAMGRPVVATPDAVEGIELPEPLEGSIVSGAEAMAARIVELVRDRSQAESLGQAGRAFVQSRFSWSRGFESLDRVLERCGARAVARVQRREARTSAAPLGPECRRALP